MKPGFVAVLALIVACSGAAFASTPSHDHQHPSDKRSAADINVPEAATDAVATVDRFTAALSRGDLTRAGAELDAGVLILESGSAERSAAEYLVATPRTTPHS